MMHFYQNVLYGENSNFPNVVVLYTIGKEILAQMLKENLPFLREIVVVIAFCLFAEIFFNFEETLINKTFKYNKVLQIHLGASLKPRIHSFRF